MEIEGELHNMLTEHGVIEEAEVILSHTLVSVHRLKAIIRALDATMRVLGDTAEIGCRDGGVSRLIALVAQRRHWACDTFQGLVDVGEHDGELYNGAFAAVTDPESYRHLCDLPNVEIVRGRFPESAPESMIDARFCLVHIDVDTYTSTLAAFEFFAPRMSKCGIIILDDVIGRGTAGAKRAWAELQEKPSRRWRVVEQNDPQVVVSF
ncbi:MAG: hypothetical protein C4583_03320 [Anaerolineaceae bacterium]|nr:MAG: hypothetical protein C4583_03320 [Anaerolineaceae bacterium]